MKMVKIKKENLVGGWREQYLERSATSLPTNKLSVYRIHLENIMMMMMMIMMTTILIIMTENYDQR